MNDSLWDKYDKDRSNIAVRNQIIEHYLPYVEKIAKRNSKKSDGAMLEDELVSYGIDGLLDAINRYNPERKIKFEYYAKMRINGSMIDEIRKQDVVSRCTRKNNNIYMKEKNRLEQSSLHRVIESEVIESLRSKNINIKKYMPTQYSPIAFHIDKNSHASTTLDIEDKSTTDSFSSLLKKELTSELRSAVMSLSDEERSILYYRYFMGYSLAKISSQINMNINKISKIHANILSKIKQSIESNDCS